MKQINEASPLRDKSVALAIRIVNFYKYLVNEKHEYIMSKQILKSGTSLGANIREAQNAESGDDFVHKLGIAQKETAETLFWLEVLYKTQYMTESEYQSLYTDTEDLLKIIRSIILTKKKNMLKGKAKNILFLLLSTYFLGQQLLM
jgi:four helix bundle protein